MARFQRRTEAPLSRLQTIAAAAAYAATPDVTSDPDDEAIDDLFRGPRESFIEARNALASRLLVAGRTSAAERVRALRKPSVSAWAVNQLWWFHRAAYDALHAAGAELAELQRSGASIAGQPANDARRAAIDALRTAAADVLREAGHGTSVATLRKVSQSLEASAAGASFGGHARLGRLETDLSPPGFGQVVQFAPEPDAAPPAHREARARRAAAELEHARATRELTDATTVLEAAEQSAEAANAALLRARKSVSEAEAALERARARHHAAVQDSDATRARLEDLERDA